MMKPTAALGFSLLLVLSVSSGLAAGLRVVTTIPPVHCFALNVAGGLATVDNLLPEGADAHDFQFTVETRGKLDRADLVLCNGLGLESWLEKAVQRSGPKRIVRCAEGFPAELLPPNSKSPNPHVWLDPILACRMVTNILVALQAADPTNSHAYTSNAAAFVVRLQKLDEEFRHGIANLPSKSMVTSHDAFPYLARRYGITIAGVIRESPELEESPAHRAALRAKIKTENVKALFVDAHENMRRARQTSRDFKVTLGVLDTLEGAPLSASAYEKGMRRNLRSLQQALK